MDSNFITILQKLVLEQGKEVLLNQVKCKALLADYTHGEYKKESRLLFQALDIGVPKAIEAAYDFKKYKQQQIKILKEEYFLAEEVAADVVDTLVLVLKGKEKSYCKKCSKELLEEWKTCPYCSSNVACQESINNDSFKLHKEQSINHISLSNSKPISHMTSQKTIDSNCQNTNIAPSEAQHEEDGTSLGCIFGVLIFIGCVLLLLFYGSNNMKEK
ncbi:MAG: hypothetical protein FWD87_08135 [Spirochaetaceae bacterium]|nr:hypothetical protein [Spirochaetaceae bacterium]